MLDVPISASVFVKLNQWLPAVELKCSFMRPAKIGTCIGEGRVLRAGRAIAALDLQARWSDALSKAV
jgi:acyl-coenzyme A thioesterase PaaI-like protein